jgi:hypothetical protein
MSPELRAAMPSLAAHAGQWAGTYRHIDAAGALIDQHEARVRCVFPAVGPYAYVQYNHFIWADGREHKAELPGILRDGRLWWDVATFRGSSWDAGDGVILLNLERKDDPDARFYEMIVLGEGGRHRARTWQWFKDGRLFKRTLCDETLIDAGS